MPNTLNVEYRPRTASLAASVLFGTLTLACASESKRMNDVDEAPTFTLSAAPTLTIRDDSTPERSFTRISARRISNGNIAIADAGSNRIIVFDRRGTVVKEVTHRGSGPGEMDQQFRMASIGDTLFAFPFALVMPVSIFDATAGLLETFKPQAKNHTTGMSPVARLSSDRWLVKEGANFRRITSPVEVGNTAPDTVILGVVTVGSPADSSTVKWFPPIVNAWTIGAAMSNPKPYPALPTLFPLKGATMFAVSGAQLWLADAETGAIAVYDSTLTLLTSRNMPLTRKPFVAQDVAAAKAAELEGARAPFARDMIEGRYDTKAIPALMPFYSAIHAGDDGDVWLQLYDISPTAAQNFIAMSSDGRPVGKLTLPAQLRVQHFGRDFVVALKTDSLGAESVLEYSIKRRP